MIVGYRVIQLVDKMVAESQLLRYPKHLGIGANRVPFRVAFAVDIEVLIAHHVDQDSVFGVVAVVVPGEEARAEEYALVLLEVSVILPIQQDQNHSDAWLLLLENAGELQ